MFFCVCLEIGNLNRPISIEKMENAIKNLPPKISVASRIMIYYLS